MGPLDENELGDKLKSNLWEPDPRSLCFGMITPTIDRYIEWMSKAKLNKEVPLSVRQYFASARNTFIYSFYDYGMSMPAQLYAFSILENTIKRRFKELNIQFDDSCGLGVMFKLAKKDNFFSLESFNNDINIHDQFHRYIHYWADHGSSTFIYKEPKCFPVAFKFIDYIRMRTNKLIATTLRQIKITGRINECMHSIVNRFAQQIKSMLRSISKYMYKIRQSKHPESLPKFSGKRNLLAHGQEMMDLPWEASHTISLCAKGINSLYHPSVESRF